MCSVGYSESGHRLRHGISQPRTYRYAGQRANRLPQRYDLSNPENQRKLDAADALGQLAGDSGIPLVQLAIANRRCLPDLRKMRQPTVIARPKVRV